jgi:hypothetical protein
VKLHRRFEGATLRQLNKADVWRRRRLVAA